MGHGAPDIRRLAGMSPGVDEQAYVDFRDDRALAAAMDAWPFLVCLLASGKGIVPGETLPGTGTLRSWPGDTA